MVYVQSVELEDQTLLTISDNLVATLLVAIWNNSKYSYHEYTG